MYTFVCVYVRDNTEKVSIEGGSVFLTSGVYLFAGSLIATSPAASIAKAHITAALQRSSEESSRARLTEKTTTTALLSQSSEESSRARLIGM